MLSIAKEKFHHDDNLSFFGCDGNDVISQHSTVNSRVISYSNSRMTSPNPLKAESHEFTMCSLTAKISQLHRPWKFAFWINRFHMNLYESHCSARIMFSLKHFPHRSRERNIVVSSAMKNSPKHFPIINDFHANEKAARLLSVYMKITFTWRDSWRWKMSLFRD